MQGLTTPTRFPVMRSAVIGERQAPYGAVSGVRGIGSVSKTCPRPEPPPRGYPARRAGRGVFRLHYHHSEGRWAGDEGITLGQRWPRSQQSDSSHHPITHNPPSTILMAHCSMTPIEERTIHADDARWDARE